MSSWGCAPATPPAHVTREGQWAGRPREGSYKGACRSPLTAAIGARASGDGWWRAEENRCLHQFILCKLRGRSDEILLTRRKRFFREHCPGPRLTLGPGWGITVFPPGPSPPHGHRVRGEAVREAMPVPPARRPGELPVGFLWPQSSASSLTHRPRPIVCVWLFSYRCFRC